MRRLTLALLLLAAPAWAEGPEYVLTAPGVSPCSLSWQTGDHFKVYLSTSKGQLGPLFATVPGQNTTAQAACPTAPGQYYWQVVSQVGVMPESVPSAPYAFVIVDPNAPPPSPPTFRIGASVQTTALLLNVRATPGGAILGTQPRNATAVIVDGPVDLTGTRWWKLHYTTGIDGWSAQASSTGVAYLGLVP